MTIQRIGGYGKERLRRVQNEELVDEFFFLEPNPGFFAEPKFDIVLFKITYPTHIPELGKPTRASALLSLPLLGAKPVDLVVYLHGTTFGAMFPSNPESSMESRLAAAVYSGQGFAILAPDYIGKGDSVEPDAYMCPGSAVSASTDAILAAEKALAFLKRPKRNLFVTGWSQGGFNTYHLLSHLQSLSPPIAVSGAIIACAPCDVAKTLRRWLAPEKGDGEYLPSVLALQLASYESYYGLHGLVERAVRPEFIPAVRALYAGQLEMEPFLAQTTLAAPALFNPSFLNSHDAYFELLPKAPDFVCGTPTRVYLGREDQVIPLSLGRLWADDQRQRGNGNVELCLVDGDHRGGFLNAMRESVPWFRQIRETNAPAIKL